jgi:hypothetical protein
MSGIRSISTVFALAVAAAASFTGVSVAGGYPTLVGVRWAAHPAYDRVVFDFTGGTPGWSAAYGTLVGEGTGTPIPLAGPADLVLHFHIARAHDDAGHPTVSLASRYPALPTVRQIGFGGDFEGYVSVGLGLRDRVGFRVFALTGPPRLVVDVAHQPSAPFGTSSVSRAGTAADVVVSGIRTGAHPGYDRAVFDVAGTALPAVRVGYLSSTSSTLVVTLVALGSATAAPHASYGGPSPVSVGLPALRSVSLASAGAGTLTFRLATAHRHGFRLALLTSPVRVVVDVAG